MEDKVEFKGLLQIIEEHEPLVPPECPAQMCIETFLGGLDMGVSVYAMARFIKVLYGR